MFGIIRTIIKNPVQSFKHPGSILHPHTWCNDAFVNFLRSKGAVIGEGTRFISPTRCTVDANRAEYITIGDNCCLSIVTLLAHDYSWFTFLDSYNDILPDGGGKIVIGNNCFIGFEAVILKNTEIGDNVIIGARAVVKGKIPSNTVWAGCPAKMICTLDELYERRCRDRMKEALFRRDFICEKHGRQPYINEMGMFGFLFLPRTEENFNLYLKNIEFNGIRNNPKVRSLFFATEPQFRSFEDFLNCDYNDDKI